MGSKTNASTSESWDFVIGTIKKLKNFISNNPMPVIALLVFVFTTWAYRHPYIGGDDSRLYLTEPIEWFKHITLNLRSRSFNSYDTNLHFVGINLLALISNLVFKELSFGALVGLVTSLGFYFCAKSIEQLQKLVIGNKKSNSKQIKDKQSNKLKKNEHQAAAIVGGLVYIFMPLLYFLFWRTFLLRAFTIAAFPMFLFFLISSVRQKSFKTVVLGNLAMLPLAGSFVDPPVTIGFLIFLAIFCVGLLWSNKNKKATTKFLGLYFLVFFLFNAYWAIPKTHSLLTSNSVVQTHVTGVDNQQDAINTLGTVAKYMFVKDTIRGYISPEFVDAFGWKLRYFSFTNSSVNRLLLLAYPLSILAGIYTLAKNKNQKKSLYLGLLLAFLVLLYLQTVNITTYGIGLFKIFIKKFSFLTMYRNYFGKFNVTFALAYSLLVSLSLTLVTKSVQKKYKSLIVYIFLVIALLQSFPFLSNVYNNHVAKTYKAPADVSENYKELVKQLPQNANARILTVPLSIGSWTIDVPQENTLYVGTQLVQVYTGLDEINGLIPLEDVESRVPGFTQALFNSMRDADLQTFFRLLDYMGINYVALNQEITTREHSDAYNQLVAAGSTHQSVPNVKQMLVDSESKVLYDDQKLLLFEIRPPDEKYFVADSVAVVKNATPIDILSLPIYTRGLMAINNPLPQLPEKYTIIKPKRLFPRRLEPVNKQIAWPKEYELLDTSQQLKYSRAAKAELDEAQINVKPEKTLEDLNTAMIKRANEYIKSKKKSTIDEYLKTVSAIDSFFDSIEDKTNENKANGDITSIEYEHMVIRNMVYQSTLNRIFKNEPLFMGSLKKASDRVESLPDDDCNVSVCYVFDEDNASDFKLYVKNSAHTTKGLDTLTKLETLNQWNIYKPTNRLELLFDAKTELEDIVNFYAFLIKENEAVNTTDTKNLVLVVSSSVFDNNWKLADTKGNDYEHVVVNAMFNGWVLPKTAASNLESSLSQHFKPYTIALISILMSGVSILILSIFTCAHPKKIKIQKRSKQT